MDIIIRNLLQLKLVSHYYHHTIKGTSFLENHKFLGELYHQYDDWYDDVVERALGLSLPVDFCKNHSLAVSYFEECIKREDWNLVLLSLNDSLLRIIEEYLDAFPCSEGTRQLLGDVCNGIEVINFKLKGIK